MSYDERAARSARLWVAWDDPNAWWKQYDNAGTPHYGYRPAVLVEPFFETDDGSVKVEIVRKRSARIESDLARTAAARREWRIKAEQDRLEALQVAEKNEDSDLASMDEYAMPGERLGSRKAKRRSKKAVDVNQVSIAWEGEDDGEP